MTTKTLKPSQRPGAFHDVFAAHQRRPLPSDILADAHGPAVLAALKVAAARKAVETWDRIATRDCDAGRPVSIQLADRIRFARNALVDAEAAFASLKKAIRENSNVEAVDDDDEED